MISLKKSLNDFDRSRVLERTAIECYCSALQCAESYLVEVDPPDTRETRSQLREVLTAVERTSDPEVLVDTRGRLRGVLRDYQERAHSQISRLRSDLESALVAMQGVADSMSAQNGDHREQLTHELMRLKATTGLQDISRIRAGVLSAVQGIETCVERMQYENQLVIAQLADEIRVLHDRVDAVGRLATLDPATGLLNRAQTETRLAVAASSETAQPLCLIYIAVRNYKLVCHESGRVVVEAVMSALAGRVRSIFGDGAQVGRWSDDEIVVLALGDPATALHLSKKAASQTAGNYPVPIPGHLRNVILQTEVLFLERRTGESASEILRRIDDFAMGPQPQVVPSR